MPQTILVVEDNAITRKMFRTALRAEGYAVLEAPDGRSAIELIERHAPDLVLQDLLLPDIDGIELLGRLRALPAGADVPILACSGFLSKMEQARSLQVGFTDYLFKPVEPSELIQIVRAHLKPRQMPRKRPGGGRRVLVVDDDPLQRKLLHLCLTSAGFRVTTAPDGAAALDAARAAPPEAIVSDVLMPRLDGFRLCLAVRQDPELYGIPVVLVSGAYLDEADRRLAARVGANGLVARTPDLVEMIERLRASFREQAPRPEETVEITTDDYTFRVIRQLEHQVVLNQTLATRLALQRAELSILSAAAETVRAGAPLEAILQELLHRCLNAAGVSRGAVYLLGAGGRLALRAQLGYAEPADALLGDFFGYADRLRQVLDDGTAAALPEPGAPTPEVDGLLAAAGAESILIVPLVFGDERLGVLWLGSKLRELGDDWLPFAGAIASQLAQAITLSRAFSRLAEAEERYRGIVENAVEGIFQSTPDGRLVTANPALARILGYDSPDELIRVAADLPRDVYVDPIRRQELIRRVDAAGFVSRFEISARRKDGSTVSLSLSARAVRDAGGVTQRYEGIVEDVTDRKRAEVELQRHREARAQAEKLAAMGELLAGVAHELNNPLSVVIGQATLLRGALAEGPNAARAEKITQAAERCGRIVKSFLALARQRSTERTTTQLNGVVQDAVELLGYALRVDSVDVRLDLAEDLPPLWADPHQLHQVVLNLVANAHHAMRGGPPPRQIVITTRHDPAAARVILRVADSGPGIPPEVQSRIFDPFFTTKPPGQGTGLGLSLCQGIAESHDGTIRVESRVGEGTVFQVELPAVMPQVAASDAPAAAAPLIVRGKRILVVDDEQSVVELLAELLALDGHQVETAANGALALSKLETGRYDLILSDLRMPELDGPGLYREVARRHPALCQRFLFLTGDTLARDTAAFLEEVGALTVSKPFSLAEVQRVVQAALRRA